MTPSGDQVTLLRARVHSRDLDKWKEGTASDCVKFGYDRDRVLKLEPFRNDTLEVVGPEGTTAVMTLGLAVQQAEQEPAVIQPAGSAAPELFELGYSMGELPFIQWLLYHI